MARSRRLAFALATIALALPPGTALGARDGSAAQRLIETYAPRLMVRAQESPPCDTAEEQYLPTSVGAVLGNPAVELTRERARGGEVTLKNGPTVADIAERDEEHHLNLPGDPLGDTCEYARDFATLVREGRAPKVTYAHLARERGLPGLVVQYWFFWYFNQFNDLHEGDWEGMQIAFGASDPQGALEEGPSEIVLYQHAGGEKASWTDGKVEKDGTHPVVYPAAGSHATFYEAAVYVENGRKGSGVGCDNTSAPHRRIDVRPVRVPTHPGPGGPFGWLTYGGRWGQLEKGFNNGPTGPSTKSRWLEPLTWMEDVRSTSPRLPAGSVLGPTVTNAFCGTVADVTSFLNRSQRDGWLLYVVPALFVLLIALIAWRTRWGPVDLGELRARRAFGQLLRTSGRLYRLHWSAFVLLGLTAIPIVLGLLALSSPITGGETGRNLDEEAGRSGLHVALGELIAGLGQPLAAAIVSAAVIVAIGQVADGGRTSFAGAYRGLWPRFWRVVGAQLLASLMLLAMALTVIGLPFAAKKYVDWLFVQQRILFEDAGVREAFRGSTRVVRGRWWYTLRVAAVLWVIGVVAGPLLGFALIFTTLPLSLINVIGSIVFAILIPYVAIGETLLYFDLEAEAEEVELRRWRRRLLRRPATA
jgi:hypothetical protein